MNLAIAKRCFTFCYSKQSYRFLFLLVLLLFGGTGFKWGVGWMRVKAGEGVGGTAFRCRRGVGGTDFTWGVVEEVGGGRARVTWG